MTRTHRSPVRPLAAVVAALSLSVLLLPGLPAPVFGASDERSAREGSEREPLRALFRAVAPVAEALGAEPDPDGESPRPRPASALRRAHPRFGGEGRVAASANDSALRRRARRTPWVRRVGHADRDEPPVSTLL